MFSILSTVTEGLGTVTRWATLSPAGTLTFSDTPAVIESDHAAERAYHLAVDHLESLAPYGYLLTLTGPLGKYHSSYHGVAGEGLRQELHAAQETAVRTATESE